MLQIVRHMFEDNLHHCKEVCGENLKISSLYEHADIKFHENKNSSTATFAFKNSQQVFIISHKVVDNYHLKN